MNILLSYNIAGSDGSSGVAARLLAGTADSGFTATAFQAADLSSYQPIGLYADNQLHALVMSGEGATRTGAYVTYENGTWSAPRMLSSAPVLSENSARDFIKVVKTSTGTGLLATGHSFADSGDTMLLNASTEEWTTLGTFGTSQSNGLVVSSATMLGGSVYVAALDASMTDDVARASTATATQGALYAFPADVAARLGSLDRSVAASAQEGGTATVADWRGDAATQATVRMQDSATWTAKPSKSYAFNGWYDINGVLVSSNETYHASVLNDTTLTAHFIATGSDGGSAEEGGVSPSSTSPSTPATLVRTGDYTLPLVALLVMLATAAAIVLTVHYRRRR